MGVNGHGQDNGLADGGNLQALFLDDVVHVRLMLHGVHIQVAFGQGLVRLDVVVEFDDFDSNALFSCFFSDFFHDFGMRTGSDAHLDFFFVTGSTGIGRRTAAGGKEARRRDENGGEDIDIIAKIENRSGVEHIEEICEIANGVMIARGDLGVEIPGMEVPAVQKYLISKCRMLGKRVITATEMLESMIHNPRPTRAELSDVANAVYDGSSAIMLSGESAAGKYPVDAVRNMAEIAEYTESQIKYTKRFRTSDFETRSIQDAISHATCAMAVDVQAKCIVASTLSGTTARMVSRFRCPVDIIGMTTSEKVWRKLNLSWGVTPVLCEEFSSMEVMFYHAMKKAKEVLSLQTGDAVVLTGGLINGKVGNTNVIKVETVK